MTDATQGDCVVEVTLTAADTLAKVLWILYGKTELHANSTNTGTLSKKRKKRKTTNYNPLQHLSSQINL